MSLRQQQEIRRLRNALTDAETERDANLALLVGCQAQLAERSRQLMQAIGHPSIGRRVTVYGSPN